MKRHSCCPVCNAEYVPLPRHQHVELARCAQCGVIFSPRIPSAEELAEHYSGYNRDHSRNNEPSILRREELLDRFEGWRQLGRVLDVGCGVGFLLDQARARGWETYGTEYTAEAVDVCREHGHTMHQGPLSEADLAPGSFDLIVYTEVIEHIYNQQEEFDLVHDLLRPGGLVYVTTPNIDSLSFRLLGDSWPVVQYPEHLVYFSPRTLTAFMRSKGLEPRWIEVTGISPSRLITGARNSASHVIARSGTSSPSTHRRSASLDNRLRAAIRSSRVLAKVRDAVDALLTVTSLGDAIKAGYEKPSNSSR